MSIRPQWVVKILNGKKTVEIRKKFPKDYVGWVYIYCCKQRNNEIGCHINYKKVDGKVVARFWCDKVEPTYKFYVEELCQLACINNEELYKYAGGWYKADDLLAIHIDKLEIFEKPKELTSFFVKSHKIKGIDRNGKDKDFVVLKPLNYAPQSWCYVEE